MGLMHKKYDIHGFQFHPESISTKIGFKLIKNFIKIKMSNIKEKLKEGLNLSFEESKILFNELMEKYEESSIIEILEILKNKVRLKMN